MLAYCGRLLRALCALTAGPGYGLAALPVRRMRRTPRSAAFGDRFPYIGRLCAGNDRRKLLAEGRPRYGDYYPDRLLDWITFQQSFAARERGPTARTVAGASRL